MSNALSTRLLLMGTPYFAVPVFDALLASGQYDIVGVVTQPDKPVGRKQRLTPPAVKAWATEHDLPVYQFASLKDPAAAQTITELKPDIAVVAAYGKLIPKTILDIPQHGCVNIHPSLLPEYRGPSPIQTALLDGAVRTGVSIMLLDEEMDHGPILGQRTTEVLADDTNQSLQHSLACEGADLLLELLPDYCAGRLQPQPQNHAEATFTTLLHNADAQIDWNKPANEIDCLIRAMHPEPGAWTDVTGTRVKVLKAHLEGTELILDQVQPAGKQPMSYEEFLNGNEPLY